MLPVDPAWHGGGGDSGVDPEGQDARPARVFVGRGPELATLKAALAAAQTGQPQVVMVQGEAGIGKSSLISEFLGGQRGVSAVTASGESAEAVLPYGVVQQLAAGASTASPGVLAGMELLSRGLGPGTDPLAVGVELRTLISSLQREQATVLVVEDLQWADLPSARALLFACRRLGADHALVVLTGRPGAASRLGEGWVRFVSGDRRSAVLNLSGLDAEELAMLCRRLGRAELPERTVGRLADHTGGNPMLARALLDELTDQELRATDGSFRAPRSLAGLILPRLTALPQPAHDLVVAASVLGEHAALADAAAVAGTTDAAAALDKAQRAGLLVEQQTPSGWAVSFPHLLTRQAVYDDLGAERRRRLHLRAAAIVGGQEALAHRAAADAVRPVIEQLPASARRDTALGQLALLAARPGDAQALLRTAWDAHNPVREASVGGEAALGLGTLFKMSERMPRPRRGWTVRWAAVPAASRGTTPRVAPARLPSC